MNVRSFLKILKFRADKKEPSLKKKQINGFLNAIYVYMLMRYTHTKDRSRIHK
jgi:hypothetical protein